VLVVGSFLRKDHPLIAHRIRQAAKRGQQVNVLHVADDDLAIKVAHKAVVRPSELPAALGQVVKALAEEKGAAVPAAVAGLVVSDAARAMARSLASGKDVGIFLGNSAQQHSAREPAPRAGAGGRAAAGARFGFLGEAANSVGGYLANCVPGGNGLNAAAMLAQPRSAYLLLNVEPELDAHHPRQALAAMHAAGFVVALTA
jgi:NADH-quinone oxidoreductase subunit G